MQAILNEGMWRQIEVSDAMKENRFNLIMKWK